MSKFALREMRRQASDAKMHAANDKAKLGARQGQCAAARDTLLAFLVNNRIAGPKQIKAVLREFWSKQPRTRPVSRILKDLTKATA